MWASRGARRIVFPSGRVAVFSLWRGVAYGRLLVGREYVDRRHSATLDTLMAARVYTAYSRVHTRVYTAVYIHTPRCTHSHAVGVGDREHFSSRGRGGGVPI